MEDQLMIAELHLYKQTIFNYDAKLLALGTFASPNAKDSTFVSPNAKDSTFVSPSAKDTNMLVSFALGDADFSCFTRRETLKLRFTRRKTQTQASGI